MHLSGSQHVGQYVGPDCVDLFIFPPAPFAPDGQHGLLRAWRGLHDRSNEPRLAAASNLLPEFFSPLLSFRPTWTRRPRSPTRPTGLTRCAILPTRFPPPTSPPHLLAPPPSHPAAPSCCGCSFAPPLTPSRRARHPSLPTLATPLHAPASLRCYPPGASTRGRGRRAEAAARTLWWLRKLRLHGALPQRRDRPLPACGRSA